MLPATKFLRHNSGTVEMNDRTNLERRMNMKDTTAMKTSDMVAEYNALTGKAIKKFSSRAAGVKQLEFARAKAKLTAEAVEVKEIPQDGSCCPACGAEHDQTYAVKSEERLFCHHCSTEYWANGKIYNAPAKSVTRAEGVRKSWSDKAVHDRRSVKHRVQVNGVEFKSVRAAFEHHGLPMTKHIKFRAQLKAAGSLAWNEKFHFTVVQAAAE